MPPAVKEIVVAKGTLIEVIIEEVERVDKSAKQ
jgi:hypothetical protein